MIAQVHLAHTPYSGIKLFLSIPFGARLIKISIDAPYSTPRAARRAAKNIAEKLGLDLEWKLK